MWAVYGRSLTTHNRDRRAANKWGGMSRVTMRNLHGVGVSQLCSSINMQLSLGIIPLVGLKLLRVFWPGEATGDLHSPWAAPGFTLANSIELPTVGTLIEWWDITCALLVLRISPRMLAIACASRLALFSWCPLGKGRTLGLLRLLLM